MSSTNLFLIIIAIVSTKLVFGWQCQGKNTPMNDDGSGFLHGANMVYLDRHYVDCGGEGLVQFKLGRDGQYGTHMNYGYTCCSISSETPGKSVSHSTSYTSDGDGNALYLDRQSVGCGSDGILTAFHLHRNGYDIRYDFNCLHFNAADNGPLTCYDTATSYEDDGDGNVHWLDRLNTQCQTNYYINSFQLNRGGGSHSWGYRFRCCHP